MKYAILWSPEAKQWFISASISAVNFPLIIDTARRIDRQLSLVPHDVGESREEGFAFCWSHL